MRNDTKWVACWGNAISITDREACVYAKDLTLRYPVRICFDGSAIRIRLSNETGTEPVRIAKVTAAKSGEGRGILFDTLQRVFFAGEASVTLLPGQEKVCDPIPMEVTAGERISVSLYLKDCTQMNAGTLITGPLSRGFYAYGDFAEAEDLPRDLTRNTNWFYFLNTIDILTEEKNHALICYGDSITAQSWPDYLALRAAELGCGDISVIRRAVSGTRILRQYDCITYQAYGLKGETRFPVEMNTAGADIVLIQHGINDIIHPVGTEVNIFRPWSDMPTLQDLTEGYTRIYIEEARRRGMQVWGGTLLPIEGWRTYAPFREELKNQFNDWLRTTSLLDGCVDFDRAVRDPEHPAAFAPGYDSGDHLHPSEAAYQRMAGEVPEALLRARKRGTELA